MSYAVRVHLIEPKGEVHALDRVNMIPDFGGVPGGFFVLEGRNNTTAIPISNISKIMIEEM